MCQSSGIERKYSWKESCADCNRHLCCVCVLFVLDDAMILILCVIRESDVPCCAVLVDWTGICIVLVH